MYIKIYIFGSIKAAIIILDSSHEPSVLFFHSNFIFHVVHCFKNNEIITNLKKCMYAVDGYFYRIYLRLQRNRLNHLIPSFVHNFKGCAASEI